MLQTKKIILCGQCGHSGLEACFLNGDRLEGEWHRVEVAGGKSKLFCEESCLAIYYGKRGDLL